MTTTTTVTNTINGVRVDDLSATVEAVKANAGIAAFTFRLRNNWADGARNTSTAEGFYGAGSEHTHPKAFVMQADEPVVLLGKNTAANPAEHLLHALAACLTTSMVYHAAARGIQIEEIESTLEGDIDLRGFLQLDKQVRNGYQGIKVKFKIKANGPEERIQELGRLAAASSPIFDSINKGVPIEVTAERL